MEIPVNFNDPNCPVRQVMDVIGNKWSVRLLYTLGQGTRRYNQLHRDLTGISHKMLTDTLRDLEARGLVRRAVFPVIPPHVEYSLTPTGESLLETLWGVARWAYQHRDTITVPMTTPEP